MNQFKKVKFTEQEEGQVSEIERIISTLKDERFGNEEQRKKFAQMIVTLVNMRDPEARKVIKSLGNFMSNYELPLPQEEEPVAYESSYERL